MGLIFKVKDDLVPLISACWAPDFWAFHYIFTKQSKAWQKVTGVCVWPCGGWFYRCIELFGHRFNFSPSCGWTWHEKTERLAACPHQKPSQISATRGHNVPERSLGCMWCSLLLLKGIDDVHASCTFDSVWSALQPLRHRTGSMRLTFHGPVCDKRWFLICGSLKNTVSSCLTCSCQIFM